MEVRIRTQKEVVSPDTGRVLTIEIPPEGLARYPVAVLYGQHRFAVAQILSGGGEWELSMSIRDCQCGIPHPKGQLSAGMTVRLEFDLSAFQQTPTGASDGSH